MKDIILYGIRMTSLEEMLFSKWLNDVSGIAMNTLEKEERTEVARRWIEEYRSIHGANIV